MFDNNKKKSKKKKKSGSSPSVNMLSEGAKVKGEIHVKDDIRIAGKLEGDLITKGKAIVTSSGTVDGNIRGVYADIAGTIEGEIRISDKIVIRKTAIIKGNVFTKTLLVEEGAQFDGSLRMSQDNEENILNADGQGAGRDAKKEDDDSKAAAKDAAKNATDDKSAEKG